jgi:hypothetical protein
MTKLVLSVCSLALILGFTACKKKSNDGGNNASIMFVHGAAAGATTVNLDARLGNIPVNGATNIQFLRNTGYVSVAPAAAIDLSFFVTGLNQLCAQTVGITAKTHYSAFASGSITAPGVVFVTDDLTSPTSGMAKVRFVNLSPDHLTTDCYIGTVKVDSNVGYQGCTAFHEIATTVSAKVSMIDQVVPANSGILTGQVLAAGKIYTYIFTGSVTGSGSSLLALSYINNN